MRTEGADYIQRNFGGFFYCVVFFGSYTRHRIEYLDFDHTRQDFARHKQT